MSTLANPNSVSSHFLHNSHKAHMIILFVLKVKILQCGHAIVMQILPIMLTVLSLQWLTYSKHIILSALITVVLMCIGRCTPLQIKRQIHYIFYHQFFLTYIQFLIKLLSSQLFGQPPPRCSLLQVTPIYNIHVF